MDRYSTAGIGQKQVINVCDGAIIGFVTDIEFDSCDGRITALIVGDCTSLGFAKGESVRIPWCNIKCFGEDTILVEIVISECKYACSCEEKKKKRPFFK
ncbi:MAG: YlmC/YmxH family sporulation protein [Ruminococcaceae bacterium]|nr:YlmC/YmxH family sporulation protein [Oscillospiraceae bacterium]